MSLISDAETLLEQIREKIDWLPVNVDDEERQALIDAIRTMLETVEALERARFYADKKPRPKTQNPT